MREDMKTRIINLQFAIFLRNIVERPDLEFSRLNSDMLNLFDDIPQVIPVPREVPVEVPVMILRSTSGEYSCNISRSRIDFFYSRMDINRSNQIITGDFEVKSLAIIKSILKVQEVSRFGLVARYFHKDNSPIHSIRRRFFSALVDGSEELGLRYNKPFSSHGLRLNDIIEINNSEMILDNESIRGVHIQRDVNNVPTQDDVGIDKFVELLPKLMMKLSEFEVEVLIK